MRRAAAVNTMADAATRIRAPSRALERYSALWCP
jgi:hypothetical protein